jgi:hypothetical protein
MSEHSREVMEKTFILASVFNSDVYLISAVKMPKVAAEEITNMVVMFVTNIYYPSKFFTMVCSIQISPVNDKCIRKCRMEPSICSE